MRAHNRLQTAISTTLLAVALMSTDVQADWPEFRGPTSDGHVSQQAVGLPLDWSETHNVAWKTETPHRGWSTPVVLGNQVWLTTATLDGDDFFVLCLDAATGKVLFNQKLFHCDKPEPLGNNVNTYASPSPAIEPGRVYLHFGTYGTACLDTKTFQTLWKRTDVNCRHFRGPASSVVLFEKHSDPDDGWCRRAVSDRARQANRRDCLEDQPNCQVQ